MASRKTVPGAGFSGGAAAARRKTGRARTVAPRTRPSAFLQGDSPKKAAEKAENKLRKTRNPLLTDLPYPFTITVHLDQLRYAWSRPPERLNLDIDVAFRSANVAALSAASAASDSFLLPKPSLTDGFHSVIDSDRLPPAFSYCFQHSPLSMPYSSGRPQSAQEPSPPADIVLIASLVDAADPDAGAVATGYVCLTKERRLTTAGEAVVKLKPAVRIVEASQEGGKTKDPLAHLAVGWEVQLPKEDFEDVKAATDEELRVVMEEELRKYEREWREEVVARHQFHTQLEAKASSTEPVHLVLDGCAPNPSSLVPGFDDLNLEDSPSPVPSFAPPPRYSHISFHPYGLPRDMGPLCSYPLYTDLWKNPRGTFIDVEKAARHALHLDDEDLKEVDDGLQRDFSAEVLLGKAALHAPDVGRITRDFFSLRALLSRLNFTTADLARLEAGAAALPDQEHPYGRFCLEGLSDSNSTLLRALRVFEERTGVTAWELQQRFLTVTGDEVIPQAKHTENCAFCGAPFCGLHDGPHAFTAILNFLLRPCFVQTTSLPTTTPPSRSDASPALTYESLNEETKQLFADLAARSVKPLDPCTASLLLGRPIPECDLFKRYRPPSPVQPPNKMRSTPGRLPWMTQGYEPCTCSGRCNGDCSCAASGTWCDRFCGCPSTCSRRFPGCTDSLCDSKSCICQENNRQCDPTLCACSCDRCANSSVRLGRQKQTQVGESKIPGAGYGLFLREPALDEELIGLYGGEAFSTEASGVGSAWQEAFASGLKPSYTFNLNADVGNPKTADYLVDSQVYGSAMRFINGSRSEEGANVLPRIIYIAGTHQIALYAKRDISANEELVMDYGKGYFFEEASGAA
ncbi:hypothetical protein JCM10207_005917 [Rhodosporidiobolus poonsookiae]